MWGRALNAASLHSALPPSFSTCRRGQACASCRQPPAEMRAHPAPADKAAHAINSRGAGRGHRCPGQGPKYCEKVAGRPRARAQSSNTHRQSCTACPCTFEQTTPSLNTPVTSRAVRCGVLATTASSCAAYSLLQPARSSWCQLSSARLDSSSAVTSPRRLVCAQIGTR
jgi:hypothetical protein